MKQNYKYFLKKTNIRGLLIRKNYNLKILFYAKNKELLNLIKLKDTKNLERNFLVGHVKTGRVFII